MIISNNYLISAIRKLEGLQQGDVTPEDVTNFIFELKVSNLLIPAMESGDELIYETFVLEDDEITMLPLFTSEEEFYMHYGEDDEYKPIANEFEIYAGIVADDGIDGIIIDVEGLCARVWQDMIEFAQEDFSISFDDIPVRSLDEIRQAYAEPGNEDLIKFISDKSNEEDFEGIMVELSNSSPFNLIVSEESLDEFAKDGVINADDVDGFTLFAIEDGELSYAALFSDMDAISHVTSQDAGYSYYGQLTRVSELFDFVLRNDMDGVVINPGTDDFIIQRQAILPQASGIDVVVEDASFRNCLEYAFQL